MIKADMISKASVNSEYARGYQDGYWQGIEDTRKGLTKTDMERGVLDIPLQGTGLSVRAQRCLQRAGCATLRDAIALPVESIRRIKNLGIKTADEIRELFHRNGVHYTAWDGKIFE